MKSRLCQTAGFTILETLVAATIATIGIGTFMLIRFNVAKTTDLIIEGLDNSIDSSYAERVLFSDFTKADSSFGILTIKDDLDAEFFDFAPDLSSNFFSLDKRSRRFTLAADGKTEIVFAIRDDLTGPPFFYDVVNAYDVGKTDSFNETAALKFVSMNRKKWVYNLQEDYQKQFPDGIKPSWWKNGQVLLLDTPARLRPLTGMGVDYTRLPRSPMFIGMVKDDDLEPLPDDILKYFDLTDPETGKDIPTVDVFFRSLPAVGGGQPMVRVRPVKIVKYYLEPAKSSRKLWNKAVGKCMHPQDLMRSVYRGNKWGRETKQTDKIGQIVLGRDSVTSKAVGFEIQKLTKPDDGAECK